MYTKQEESKNRQAFWTTFGHYMEPVVPAEEGKVSWVNYKTGIPGISFKMDADGRSARIAIVLSAQDVAVQQAHYDQLVQLRALLHDKVGEAWEWHPPHTGEYGKVVSRIGTAIANVNINRNEDWPALISFFKTRIVGLDAFWAMVKDGF